MRLEDRWYDLHLEELLDSYLPDFIIAFSFFTSVVYGAVARHFEKQRPAIAMSAAIGLALSTGLVWWERAHDFSIKNLGPIAVGFALLLLAFVMYACIRHIGGSWAGAGITIGVSILIALLLGIPIPFATQILQTVIVVALIFGVMAFISHQHHLAPRVHLAKPTLPDVNQTMARLYRDRHLSEGLDSGLRKLRKKADLLQKRPEEGQDIIRQITRMLPAQGYLTERMAQLRAKAHQIRNGHVARLEETRETFARLPPSAKKKAAAELAARYNQMVGIETRLERLDKVTAENERRIRELTGKAREYTAKYDYQQLHHTLKAAEKLQHHNSKLIKVIERTEHRLSAIAKEVAQEVKQVGKPEGRNRGSVDGTGPALRDQR
jgi:hypothetical protein